jgi:hypothetical protein
MLDTRGRPKSNASEVKEVGMSYELYPSPELSVHLCAMPSRSLEAALILCEVKSSQVLLLRTTAQRVKPAET